MSIEKGPVSKLSTYPSLELLSLIYLLLPHLLFCLGWLRLYVGLPMTLLWIWGSWCMFGKTQDGLPWHNKLPSSRILSSVLILSLLLSICSGIGGLSYQREDYQKHNLIYHDLLHQSWPVVDEDCNEEPYFLSYYLGYYLVAAGLASIVNPAGLEVCSFLWGWLGIALALLWICRLLPARPILAMGLFICFGGLDVIENLFRAWDVGFFGTALPYPMALTVDCQLPEQWGLGHNYPGHMSQLGWAPQHAISGWLAAAWCMHEILNRQCLKHVGFILALTLFWSPFIFLGLAGLVGIAVIKAGIRPAISWHNLLPPLLWVGIMAAYYGAHPPLAYNGFVWEYAAKPGWGVSLLYFGLGEFGIFGLLLLLLNKQNGGSKEDRFWMWAVLGLLTVILFYRIGRYNDVSLRVSGPPVLWMCILIGRSLTAIPRTSTLRLVLLVCLGIGSLVPLQEIVKNLAYPVVQMAPSLVEAIPPSLPGYVFIRHTLLREGASYSSLTATNSIRDIEAPCEAGVHLPEDALFWQYVGKLDAWYYRVLSR
ncbi:MAG: hypothetical protein AAF587_15280 [Bacteroidota bacterium]